MLLDRIERLLPPRRTKSYDLIFDIGMNHGEDTQFYLAKGFRVVGVEANPLLAEENRTCQLQYVEQGRLTVENVGVMDAPGNMPFYRNLANDHWSSFFESYGCRDETPFEVIQIRCVTILSLIEKHGCPYYMKIDVEGADKIILHQLRTSRVLPHFISVEEFGAETFDYLSALGYNRFSVRPQQDKSWAQAASTSREGEFAHVEFSHRDSGLFGRDVPDWLSLDDARSEFARNVRSLNGEWLAPPGEFYDIHATFQASLTR